MKINRTTLSLIIASLCGTGSSACVMGQDANPTSPVASTGRIGDSGAQVQADDPRMGSIRSLDPVQSPAIPPQGYHPVAFQSPDLHMPGTSEPIVHDTISAPTQVVYSTPAYKTASKPSSTVWLESETLLWWGKGFNSAPTVVGGNAVNVLPTTSVSGGQDNPLANEMMLGSRITAGLWLDGDQNYGIEGRVFGIIDGSQTTRSDNGGNSLGVGFFDTSLGIPNALLATFDNGIDVLAGTVTSKTDVDLISTDISGKVSLVRSCDNRLDASVGYTFLRLDTSYRLDQDSLVIQGFPVNGRVRFRSDMFDTKNTFHGGHLGLSNQFTTGRFTFSTMGKVAIGNMEYRTRNSGQTIITDPGPVVTVANQGLFARTSNAAGFTRNSFTFIPEINTKLKYRIAKGQLGLGYSLLVLPDVALATDQIDQNVDFGNVNLIPTPLPKFTTNAYFLHGLDFGYTLQF